MRELKTPAAAALKIPFFNIITYFLIKVKCAAAGQEVTLRLDQSHMRLGAAII